MRNNRIEKLLPIAHEVLKTNETIVKDGNIEKALRGQISSFGAAILTGTLSSAVAFFSDRGRAKTPREVLVEVIFEILKRGEMLLEKDKNAKDMKELVFASKDPELQEKIIDASVAVKLAMNFFTLT